MSISNSPHKTVIAEYFDYDFDLDFLDVAANAIDRIDNYADDEEIAQAIDDSLIYYNAQWKVLQHYCTPSEANYEEAYEQYANDIFAIASKIAEQEKEDEEDE